MSKKVSIDYRAINKFVPITDILDMYDIGYDSSGFLNKGFRSTDDTSSVKINIDSNTWRDYGDQTFYGVKHDKSMSVLDLFMFLSGIKKEIVAGAALTKMYELPYEGDVSELEKLAATYTYTPRKFEKRKDISKDLLVSKQIERLLEVYQSDLIDVLPKELIDYANKRGIEEDTLRNTKTKFHIDQDGIPNFAFCSYYKDQIANVSFKPIQTKKSEDADEKSGPKAMQEKGGYPTLWGYEQIDDSTDYVYIIEGQFDKLSLNEMGVKNVLSLTNGVNSATALLKDEQFLDLVERKEIRILFDNDRPGYQARYKFQKAIIEYNEKARVKQASIPEKYKDANEMLLDDPFLLSQCVYRLKDKMEYSKQLGYDMYQIFTSTNVIKQMTQDDYDEIDKYYKEKSK